MFALLLLAVIRNVRREIFGHTPLLWSLVLDCAFLPYALVGRCHFSHLLPLYVICVCITTLVIGLCCRLWLHPAPLLVSRFSIAISSIGIVLLSVVFARNVLEYKDSSPLEMARTKKIVVRNNNAELQSIVDLVNTLQKTGETHPIFIGCTRHDRVFVNPIMIYFLADRPSGTYFHHFDPGITTTADIQKLIVQDLQMNKVTTIVISDKTLPDEPNLGSQSSNVYILDKFIAEQFRTTDKFGLVQVMHR